MNDSSDDHDTHEEAWPFEQVLMAGRDGARNQQSRFQQYVIDNDPALAAALASEAERFEVVSRSVIEPAMHVFADEASQRGWQVSVVRDDDLDRMAMFATPGVRFYCSRRPSPAAAGDLIWPLCFVGFFGSVRELAVGTHVELSQLAESAVPSSEPLLAYSEVTSETVRAVLVDFLGDLERMA